MDSVCANCKYYRQDYYLENGMTMRASSGYCRRQYLRKKCGETCKHFSLRESEREEEQIIRRQELYTEIEELTVFLSKIKCLAEVVIQIQEMLNKKE